MRPYKQSGFTLIEIMIVVAIVGILAAIALPSYTDYVRRGRIPEATNGLSSMSVRLEQYFQDRRTYVGACAAAGTGTVADLVLNTTNFTFSCDPEPTATTYTVTATGVGPMAGFTFTINQIGGRATTAVPSDIGWDSNAECWVTAKGGVC